MQNLNCKTAHSILGTQYIVKIGWLSGTVLLKRGEGARGSARAAGPNPRRAADTRSVELAHSDARRVELAPLPCQQWVPLLSS